MSPALRGENDDDVESLHVISCHEKPPGHATHRGRRPGEREKSVRHKLDESARLDIKSVPSFGAFSIEEEEEQWSAHLSPICLVPHVTKVLSPPEKKPAHHLKE